MLYTWHPSWGRPTVVKLDGRTVAEVLRTSTFMHRGRASINNAPWVFGTEHGSMTATKGEDSAPTLIATARGWSSRWQVRSASAEYELVAHHLFSMRHRVRRGGVEIGRLRNAGGVLGLNRPRLEVDDEVPVADAVFLMWILNALIRRRQWSGGGG